MSWKEKIQKDIREIEEVNENPVAFGRARGYKDEASARRYARSWIRQTSQNLQLYVSLMETEVIEAANKRFDAEREELGDLAFGAGSR